MTSGTETVRVLVAHNRNEGKVDPGEEIVVSSKEARELETMGWAINVEKADLGDLAAADLIAANEEEQELSAQEADAEAKAQEDKKERVLGSSSSHYTGEVDTQGRVKSFEQPKEQEASAKEESKSKSSSKSKSKE
jgi:hypothetical protein